MGDVIKELASAAGSGTATFSCTYTCPAGATAVVRYVNGVNPASSSWGITTSYNGRSVGGQSYTTVYTGVLAVGTVFMTAGDTFTATMSAGNLSGDAALLVMGVEST